MLRSLVGSEMCIRDSSDTFFEFADVGPEEAQHSSLASFLQVLVSLFYGLTKKVAVRACPKTFPRLLSLLPCCLHISLHARVRAPTLWSARALRARCNFCRNGNHKSAMPAAMSLMQVPLGMGDSAALIELATWRRRSGSAINRCRSTVFRVALVLSSCLVRTFLGYGLSRTRLWSDSADSRGGDRTLTQRTSRRPACFVRM